MTTWTCLECSRKFDTETCANIADNVCPNCWSNS